MPDGLALAVGGLAAANIVLGASLAPSLLRRGAPFVPIAGQKLAALFGPRGLLRPGGPGSLLDARAARHRAPTLIDLGAGEGRVLRAATRAGFGRAIGYEVNPALVAMCRARAAPNEVCEWRSLWDAGLGDADVVTVYGCPPIMDRLGAKLRAELRAGALVCSNAYALPDGALGPPVAELYVETGRWAADASSMLLFYRAGNEGAGGASRPECSRH